jgi:hypothetical protein
LRSLDDLQVYRRLLDLATELRELADAAWSPASSTALLAAATIIRRLASAVFRRINPSRRNSRSG